MIAKLRSEWTHEEIVRVVRKWCRHSGYQWDATIEWRRREELFEMFLTPTGRYGGAIRGHALTYTNQQPEYLLDEHKLRKKFDKSYRERLVVDRPDSKGHVWIPRNSRVRKGSRVNRGEDGEKLMMGTGHISFGGGPKGPVASEKPTPSQEHDRASRSSKAYDADKAAALLRQKYGNRVKRAK